MWAALIAVLIPWVDAISVWRGPTEYVVEEQPQIFDTVSIAFRVPGEDGTANLGPPDILFRLPRRRPLRAPRRVDVARDDGLLGATLIVTATTDVSGLGAAGDLHRLLPNADTFLTAPRPAWPGAGADLRPHGRALLRPRRRRDRADVPTKVVLLTREQPPVTATVEPVDRSDAFTVEPEPAGRASPAASRSRAATKARRQHDLPNGLVIVPQDDVSSYLEIVHPEQLAAEEDKVERLKRERR